MSDDFFSNVPLRRSSPDNDPHNDFAHAISLRFGSADLRTARLLPDDLPTHNVPSPLPSPLPHSPLSPLPPSPPLSPPQTFSSVPPSALPPYLADPHSLLLDIRPHAAHAAARINNALSLSVPTTLLKRPLFPLSKLSQMLPSPSSRARLADWPSASRILVYDSDSVHSPDNSVISGLLRKFRAEGYTGELSWLHGGFQAVWREYRDLATTEPPPPEEEDPDATSFSGTLRTTHLPKAAFSLFSTTAAPPLQPGAILGAIVLPNTPAPSASRAANPFFDTIRQNVELSHGITERIPLRLPRRVRRRINDLPSRWLQDIARRSALRPPFSSRHPGLDSFESGSESSDDPHTSDPEEHDPDVEEGTEALAMQFYRIELAEQRRLRSIMEHHTRESQVHGFAAASKHYRDGGVRTGVKSVPSTPHPTPFPFSITAAVEKGTKNRYTHIWPFEHARVRLHDGRHRGSYHKIRTSEHGRSARDQSGRKGGREEQRQHQDKHRRSRSSPAHGKGQDRVVAQLGDTSSKHDFDARSIGVAHVGPTHPIMGASVPRVKIEYDTTEQDPHMSGPPTPATALPLATPPFYTPMEVLPAPTPMCSWPPQLPSSASASQGGRLAGAQLALPTLSLPYLGPLPSFPLRLPNRPEGLLPSIGEKALSSMATPFASKINADGEDLYDSGTMRSLRREPSPADDYVNASYVQPLCTRRRYIATQGPLPSTYVDFWTLVWEQNVHVIVMLTREVENAMVKCGSYWTENEYGPLRLQLLSTSPPVPGSSSTTGDIPNQGFFAIREPQGKVGGVPRDQPTLITRTFLLNHASYPGVPPRTITHLQYLDWSDMNVPDDPRGVLDLVKKVEQAVAESTPGPSRSGSPSPGSGSSSLSGGQSPDTGPGQGGHGTSLLSPTSAGFLASGTKGRRGSKWRHPELDSKCGITAFALGKPAPVLLHCSAGVGRTGGFIAVDAILDGIRRELRKAREERRAKATKVGVIGPVGTAGVIEVQARELSAESVETGIGSPGSCASRSSSDESEDMDVDEPAVDKVERSWNPLRMINTVPIHVSAGDCTNGRKHCKDSKDPSGEKQSSSSESLVVHVPYAGTNDAPDGTGASIDLGSAKEADWQSSTREWVEKVSDQTHVAIEEGSLPPPILPLPSRERSPGSTSNSSDPSALNSADDFMSGSTGARREDGNTAEHKSDTGSASASGTGSGSRSGRQAPSLVSKPGSGSISHSTSGSGTGTGSQIGSSLLCARLRESSVTSVSAESIDSFSPQRDRKSNSPLHRLKVTHTKSSSDMDVDFPPRPVSEPLQPPTYLSTVKLRHNFHSRRDELITGPLPVARSSSLIPPATAEKAISFGSDVAEGSVSRPSSDLGSDELKNPLEDLGSGGSTAVEVSRKNIQGEPEAQEGLASSNPELSLRLNTGANTLKAAETFHNDGTANNVHSPSEPTKGKERAIMMSLRSSADAARPSTSGVHGPSEHDQRARDYQVIDYKLPRELHSDLSPPLISSFAEPICTIVQDMREQRMSLCQSLRQYVFVHAAIIEGALRIVDEERELWGYNGASDDSSSAEGDLKANTKKGYRWPAHSEANAWLGGVVAVRPALGGILPRTPPLHTRTHPSNPWGSESNIGGGQTPLAPGSSSSGVSSPPKGKRAPSPTELLREDKTGALTLNKRPSINRKRMNDDAEISFESRSPVAGQDGGGSRDAAVGTSEARFTAGRLAVSEKGGHTFGGAR